MRPQELKRSRMRLHLSQQDVAARLGVAASTVNRWERGRTKPGSLARAALTALFATTDTTSRNGRQDAGRGKYTVPTAVALFAGAGGLHLGFHRAGFRLLMATDVEPAAQRTHEMNWPGIPFVVGDIRTLSGDDILRATLGERPDVIVGGPPCQGFSTLGDKLSADPRNLLFEDFARIVQQLMPAAVVVENVRSIATMYGGRYKDYVIDRFRRAGYVMHFDVLDAAEFGVPQHRLRAFFVGFRNPEAPFTFPRRTHGDGAKPLTTVGDAIMDLVDRDNEIPGHIVLNHSDVVVRRYSLIPEGGRLPPPQLLPEAIRRTNFGNTYKRLDRTRPSLTLVPGNNAFPVHPTLDRSLTPREAARLQTFPDHYSFAGDRRRQGILVGSAVPPRLAQAVARSVKRALRKPDARATSAIKTTPLLYSDQSPRGGVALAPLDARLANAGFVDLFSGAGGFTIGFARSGLQPICSVDIDDHVALTHSHNYPAVPFIQGDLSSRATQEAIGSAVGEELLAVVGGPPCQGFSVFGKRRFVRTRRHDARTDDRNRLVFAFVEAIRSLRPRWVVMENVVGFATLDGGSFLAAVAGELDALGYNQLEYRVLNSADFGVPQLRRRFVMIANRTGHIIPWPKRKFFENPEEWQKPFRTVGEVLTDLAEPSSYDQVTCHVPMNHKPLLVERFRYIPEGDRLHLEALPDRLRRGYRTRDVKNYSHVFRRLHRAKPSFTLVPGHNAFPIHPWLDRALTVREAARIQTFPDEVEFKGPRQEQCIQVGNAFPPLLAQLIADNIVKAERNGWHPGRVPRSALYSLIDVGESAMPTEAAS